MSEKHKSKGGSMSAAPTVKAADQLVAPTPAPIGEAPADPRQKVETTEPAPKKSAAVRMMTRSVGGPLAAGGSGKAKSQRIADASKPSQKPTAGGSSRVIRRGASKGR